MSEQRRQQLEKLIAEAYDLITESESQLLDSESPRERRRLNREIEDTREQLEKFEAELARILQPAIQIPIFGTQPAIVLQPKVYHNLPRPEYGIFIGREPEIERLKSKVLASTAKHYIATIDGVGGVGKSALALEVAYRYLNDIERDQIEESERFAALIWISAKQTVLTSRGIVSKKQAIETLEDIFREITVTINRQDILRAELYNQQHLVIEALESLKRTLLIIDNWETINIDKEVREFLDDLPASVKIVVTTRKRIDTAVAIRLTGMPETDALALIEQECEKKEVKLSEDEARTLFKRTGGLPIALILSIGWMRLRGYKLEYILTKLGSTKSDLAQFCFHSSLDEIQGSPSYRLLNALAFFPEETDRSGLMQVAEFGEDDATFEESKADLVTLSLVNENADRYSLPPLIRFYVLEKLKENSQNYEQYRNRFTAFMKAINLKPSEEYSYWYEAAKITRERKRRLPPKQSENS